MDRKVRRPLLSPRGKVLELITKNHIRLYRATGGILGMTFWSPDDALQRMDCLLLTTIGNKSGLARTVALPFFTYDGRTFLFASNAAQANNPAWFRNLCANPSVRVQIGKAELPMRAVPLEGDERDHVWRQHIRAWPRWASYEQQVERQIPVVELTAG